MFFAGKLNGVNHFSMTNDDVNGRSLKVHSSRHSYNLWIIQLLKREVNKIKNLSSSQFAQASLNSISKIHKLMPSDFQVHIYSEYSETLHKIVHINKLTWFIVVYRYAYGFNDYTLTIDTENNKNL